MNVANWFLRLAVLFALLGMTLGIVMGARHDFTLAPVHAHVNLVGWVSMFLYGLFYKLVPEAGEERLAAWQFGLAVPGLAAMIIGIAAIVLGNPVAEPLAILGACLTLAGMTLFTVVVFRHSRAFRMVLGTVPAE